MINPIELVAFDMAGTTVRDEHEVETCFREAALRTGLEMTEEEILAVQGWGKRFVFETYWERQLRNRDAGWKQSVDRSFNAFTEILEHHYLTQPIVPTEGALEVFAFLRENGVKIALPIYFTILDMMTFLSPFLLFENSYVYLIPFQSGSRKQISKSKSKRTIRLSFRLRGHSPL